MSPRTAARTAWSLCAVTFAAAVVQVVLRVPQLDELADAYDPFLTFPIITAATLAAAVVGAVIVVRHPANPVGWLFCVTNCVAEVGLAAEAYAEFSGLRDTALPAAGYAASFQALTGAPFALGGLALLLLLFPDGRLLSRRWLPAAWLTGGSLLLFELGHPGVRRRPARHAADVAAAPGGCRRRRPHGRPAGHRRRCARAVRRRCSSGGAGPPVTSGSSCA